VLTVRLVVDGGLQSGLDEIGSAARASSAKGTAASKHIASGWERSADSGACPFELHRGDGDVKLGAASSLAEIRCNSTFTANMLPYMRALVYHFKIVVRFY
jgi:hypothetical protein